MMEISSSTNYILWAGMGICITQSAMFSGLNLAFFSIPRLRLEIEAGNQNKGALKVLKLREDSNFLLATILWGNVGINVLLTLLSNSVMAGVSAFVFSTFLITFLGEIIPQAYFSRHALSLASKLSPILIFYQYLLYPFTKPSAKMLDWLVGPESLHYFKEKSLAKLIYRHVVEDQAEEIDFVEGMGAINFLSLDDISADQEGKHLHPASIIQLDHQNGHTVFPGWSGREDDEFLKNINRSGEKWIVITDYLDNPIWVMDADGFLRAAIFENEHIEPVAYCHKPIVIKDASKKLGDILQLLRIEPESDQDYVIDQDIILLWGHQKQIITGADILGRLLKGIAVHDKTQL